jgi:hypothetical protein
MACNRLDGGRSEIRKAVVESKNTIWRAGCSELETIPSPGGTQGFTGVDIEAHHRLTRARHSQICLGKRLDRLELE